MTSSPPSKLPATVGELLRRRLREIKRSQEELAEAIEVPTEYIDDLIEGSRRPPLPGRTDIYEKMTSFLRLGRNDVVACARAERASTPPAGTGPGADVRRLMFDLCDPRSAKELERRRARRGGAEELASVMQRVLDVAQGAVRRVLDDRIGLRLAAAERGSTYVAMRLRVLEFLDATPDTLTAQDLTEFLRPRIARWNMDLDTGVLRVVLREHEPRPRERRTAVKVTAPDIG
jgi:hypothetical protein